MAECGAQMFPMNAVRTKAVRPAAVPVLLVMVASPCRPRRGGSGLDADARPIGN